MESRLPISEYPKAWKEYNRRWFAAWISFIALIPYAIFDVIAMKWMLKHVSWIKDLAGPKALFWILIIPGAVVFMILLHKFLAWHCPRCGFDFFSTKSRFLGRPNSCFTCGLRRNAVSADEIE